MFNKQTRKKKDLLLAVGLASVRAVPLYTAGCSSERAELLCVMYTWSLPPCETPTTSYRTFLSPHAPHQTHTHTELHVCGFLDVLFFVLLRACVRACYMGYCVFPQHDTKIKAWETSVANKLFKENRTCECTWIFFLCFVQPTSVLQTTEQGLPWEESWLPCSVVTRGPIKSFSLSLTGWGRFTKCRSVIRIM